MSPATDAASDSPVAVAVRLDGLDIGLLRATQETDDALMREVELMAKGASSDPTVDAGHLSDVLARLREIFASFRPALEVELRALLDAGADRGDVVVAVDRELALTAADADALFMELEQLARRGTLLTVPPKAPASETRRWILAQFAEQAAGAPARTWDDWWAEHSR